MGWKKGQSGNPAGKPKGALARSTMALREMILLALDKQGGVKYLEGIARDEPVAFCGLIGKVLPTQLTGLGDTPLQIQIVSYLQTKSPPK